MQRIVSSLVLALLAAATLSACVDEDSSTDADDTNTSAASTNNATTNTNASTTDATNSTTTQDPDETPNVAYEILQIISPSEVIVWITLDMTQEEFDAIALPQGWFKNQPREGEPDGSAFARSPGAEADGTFTIETHFGHTWRHIATVVEMDVPIDEAGLLRANTISKTHTLEYDADRTVWVLVSPEGDAFIRVSRDAGRTTDTPTIPAPWRLVEHTLTAPLTVDLPNPTTNIRVDNEDSFQGPVEALRGL